MGATCGGQGEPGNTCTEFKSPCLLSGKPLTFTLGEPCALTGTEQ